MQYKYVAKDLAGKLHRASIEVDSVSDLYKKLSEQNLFCISYEETQRGKKASFTKLTIKEVSMFCRQLSTMLSSGMTVVRALDILYERAETNRHRQIYLRLYEDIQKGFTLHEAMREQPRTFPPLLVNMVQSGELSGNIDDIMLKMADHYERENKMQNKIKTSMMYPLVLISITVAVILMLFVFVLPNFFTMFENGTVPTITRVIMNISGFLINRWYVALGVILALVLAIAMLLQFHSVRLWLDWAKLRIWVFGKINRTIAQSRFTNSMSILYSSGISIIDAIDTGVVILNNRHISKAFEQVLEDIREGAMLSTSIEKTGIFDKMLTSMIFMGEESGGLDVILRKISDFYEGEAQSAIDRMMALLEPMMMIIIAIVIGVVVAAVFLPIYDMYGSVL